MTEKTLTVIPEQRAVSLRICADTITIEQMGEYESCPSGGPDYPRENSIVIVRENIALLIVALQKATEAA